MENNEITDDIYHDININLDCLETFLQMHSFISIKLFMLAADGSIYDESMRSLITDKKDNYIINVKFYASKGLVFSGEEFLGS